MTPRRKTTRSVSSIKRKNLRPRKKVKTKTTAKKKRSLNGAPSSLSGPNCRITHKVHQAGRLLKIKSSRRAGSVLATEGKEEKRKRKKRGCLNGPAGTFQLTDRQRCKLPISLQRAIITSHRKKGDRILGLDKKINCKKIR